MSKRKYLSIGEVSKLTDIHIKSLRYYDRIGILKAAYIDPATSYRYYTYSQLSIIEAIRICIELGIPLKQFAEYTEDDGQRVHYAKLLEHGKELAEQKFRAIRDGLSYINELQDEIKRNDAFYPNDNPSPVVVPRKRYMLEPIQASANEGDFHQAIGDLYMKATGNGYKVGYDLGLLYIYRDNGEVERYQFIDILSAPKGKRKDTTVFSSGQYLIRHVSQSSIETAPEMFPELFYKGADLVVVESEMFTGEYNSAQPLYELRCSMPTL